MNCASRATTRKTGRLIAFALCLLALAGCDLGPSGGQTPGTPTSLAQLAPTRTSTAALSTPTQLPSATASDTPVPVQATATAMGTPVPPPPTSTPAPPTKTPTRAAPSPTATARPEPTATPTATRRPAGPPTSTPRPAPAHTAVATPTRAVSQNSQIELITNGFGSPDDLFVAPDGEILFGDFGNSALNGIRPGEAPRAIAGGFNEPEGITIAKDGAIIVAEQGTNRIIEVDPTSGQKKVLRQLVNRTGQDGVDGISLDPATGDILIPDSPNGRLLRLSRDGGTLTTIATGFVRPTGVAVEPGGTMVVADEFGNAVYRLRANGSKVRLASIFQPDDIIVGPDGSIYVNSLGGDIVRIDPVSGAKHVLISGLKLPHGLGMDPAGHLVVAEAGRNRIFRLK